MDEFEVLPFLGGRGTIFEELSSKKMQARRSSRSLNRGADYRMSRHVPTMKFEPIRKQGALLIGLHVDSLASAAMVQFALAVAESKTYSRCIFCSRPIENDSSRTDKLYCSDNCRVKHHQHARKKRSHFTAKARACE